MNTVGNGKYCHLWADVNNKEAMKLFTSQTTNNLHDEGSDTYNLKYFYMKVTSLVIVTSITINTGRLRTVSCKNNVFFEAFLTCSKGSRHCEYLIKQQH